MTASRRLRSSIVAVVAAGVFGCGAVALCGDDPPAAPAAPAAPPGGEVVFVPAPAEIVIMLSGREQGLMKPCTCSEPQRGGLIRRAALWDQVRAVSKASAAVSLGETLSEGMPQQEQIKAELFRAALSAMDYRGMLLSAADLAGHVTSLTQPYGGPADTPRPPLNVRVKPKGSAPASASVDPVLRFDVGGLKVRAVSVVDPVTRGELVAEDVTDTVQAPETALLALPKEPGLLIVAAHVYRESLALVVKAAQAVSEMAVVVDVLGDAAYDRPVVSHDFSKPLFVTFSEKGKAVGLVRLARSAKAGGTGWTASYEMVFLDPPFETTVSKTAASIRDDLFAAYRQRVVDEKLLEAFGRFPDSGPAFVGSAACAKCHEAIHASWQATPHASAYTTLVDKGVDRDPECVTCHTVGWMRGDRGKWSRNQSSFFTPEASKHLLGVGCESCHGAGSEHVKWPDKKELFGPWRAEGKMWKDFGRTGCAQCHDAENSVPFNAKPDAYEKDYRPIVDHNDVPKEKRTVVPK